MTKLPALPSFLGKTQFNYFDGVVLVWLIIGLFVGRKKGMSQELLPLMQWIGIIVAGAFLYWPLSPFIHQYLQISTLWSCITGYLLVALGVHLIYKWFKQMFAEKLVEKDPFGRSEFYLGMVSGVLRYACMVLFAMALLNSRIESAAEKAQTEKFQAANFSDIRFPTYGEFQEDVLFKSFAGKLVESHLKPVLIAAVAPPASHKKESIAQKSNKDVEEIISTTSKH
jgi:uncharacterized membrane protein required for colicin V production